MSLHIFDQLPPHMWIRWAFDIAALYLSSLDIFHRKEAGCEDEEPNSVSSLAPPTWKASLPNLPQTDLQSQLAHHHFHPWTEALEHFSTKLLFCFKFEWTSARRVLLRPLLGSWRRKYRLEEGLPPSIGGNPVGSTCPSRSGWTLSYLILVSYHLAYMWGSFVRGRSTWVWSSSTWRTRRTWEKDFHPRSLIFWH